MTSAVHASTHHESPARWRSLVLAILVVLFGGIGVLVWGVGSAWAAPSEPTLSVDDPLLVLTAAADAVVTFTVTLERPELAGTGVDILRFTGAAVFLAAAGIVVLALVRRGSRAGLTVAVVLAAGVVFATGPAPAAVAAPSEPVTVAYHTDDGTLSAPGDYDATSGTLVFDSESATAAIPVTVHGESMGGTFVLVLTDAHGAVLGDERGTATVMVPSSSPSAPDPSPSPSISPSPSPSPSPSISPSPSPSPSPSSSPSSSPGPTPSPSFEPQYGLCVVMGEDSYRIPDGAHRESMTFGDAIYVEYLTLEVWSNASCSGGAADGVLFFFNPAGHVIDVFDAEYPDHGDTGYTISDVTILPFGTGTLHVLTR